MDKQKDAFIDDLINRQRPVYVCLVSYYDRVDNMRKSIDVHLSDGWYEYELFDSDLRYEGFHYQINANNIKDLDVVQQNKIVRRLEADNYTPNLTRQDTYGKNTTA